MSSTSAATELRSRIAEPMHASNFARAASGIRPRSKNWRTVAPIRLWTSSSATTSRGSATSRRACSPTSWRNVSVTRSPQAAPSTTDRSRSGAQATRVSTRTRRCNSSSASPLRRDRRQTWYSGPPRTSEKSGGAAARGSSEVVMRMLLAGTVRSTLTGCRVRAYLPRTASPRASQPLAAAAPRSAAPAPISRVWASGPTPFATRWNTS